MSYSAVSASREPSLDSAGQSPRNGSLLVLKPVPITREGYRS
jgi:hypothetical protein